MGVCVSRNHAAADQPLSSTPAHLKQVGSNVSSQSSNNVTVKKEIDQQKFPRVHIRFASQSGTGETAAKRLAETLNKILPADSQATCHDLALVNASDSPDAFPTPEEHESCLFVVFCSSTGAGVMPLGAEHHPEQLKCLPHRLCHGRGVTSTCGARLAMVGLGDSAFETYLRAPKLLFESLVIAGAAPLMPLREADFNKKQVQSLQSFSDAVSNVISEYAKTQHWPENRCESVGPDSLPQLDLRDVSPELESDTLDTLPRQTWCVYSNELITGRKAASQVRCLRLRPEAGLHGAPSIPTITPGCVLKVWSNNNESAVAILLERFGWSGEQSVQLIETDSESGKQFVRLKHQSLKDALSHDLDFMRVNSAALKVLAEFTKDSDEQSKLKTMSKPGSQLFNSWVVKAKRTLLDVINEYPSIESSIPVEKLLPTFTRLQPRYFSAASFPENDNVKEDGVRLLIGVLSQTLAKGRLYKGIATNFLASCAVGQNVMARVEESSFVPSPSRGPIILIGAGTGIAPLINIIEFNRSRPEAERRRCMLIFGCRYQKDDNLLQEVLDSYESEGFLTVHRAISREPLEPVTESSGQHEKYVQHIMLGSASEQFVDMIMNDGCVMICGRANMATEVGKAYNQLREKHGDLPKRGQMMKARRWKEDAWDS